MKTKKVEKTLKVKPILEHELMKLYGGADTDGRDNNSELASGPGTTDTYEPDPPSVPNSSSMGGGAGSAGQA